MVFSTFASLLRCGTGGSAVYDRLRATHSRRPSLIKVIPKAVESSDDFQPQPLSPELQRQFDGGSGRSAYTFLYMATCSLHKNHATVITAMEILRARGVPARLALSVTEEQLAKYGTAPRVASLVKSGHLVPLGWIDKTRLAAVYEASDACVMPSYLEQLSSAHIEAMHWKKPQISADLPYAHDLCGDATLYADPDDPEDWADQMCALKDGPMVQQQLVAAGLERMSTFPKTWREVACHMRAFLADVVDRHRKAPREDHRGA